MPDFTEPAWEHPDPRYPDFWAQRTLDIAGRDEAFDPAKGEAHWKVTSAETTQLVELGYTEKELMAALERAIDQRMNNPGGEQ